MVPLRAIKVDVLLVILDEAPPAALEPHAGAQVQSATEGGAPGASSPVADPAAGTRFDTPLRNGKKRRAPNLDPASAWEFIRLHEFEVSGGEGEENERKARMHKCLLCSSLPRRRSRSCRRR